MLETINNLLGAIDDFVWGVPLIVLILATGIYLTIRVKCLQISKLPRAIHYMFHSESEDLDGEVSSFAALCTALSATIGTGNIVGVATAIVAGGPGALFWMWIAAFLGTATKYAEGLLAVKYRTVAEDPYANIPSVFPHIPQALAHTPLSAFPSAFPDCTFHHMFPEALPDLPVQNPYNYSTGSSADGL